MFQPNKKFLWIHRQLETNHYGLIVLTECTSFRFIEVVSFKISRILATIFGNAIICMSWLRRFIVVEENTANTISSE